MTVPDPPPSPADPEVEALWRADVDVDVRGQGETIRTFPSENHAMALFGAPAPGISR